MPDSPVYVNVPPQVMTWIRESSGYSIEAVSQELDLPLDCVIKWETGDKKPTIDNLRELSKAFNRSLSAFFLPAPLKERDPPRDYRRFPDSDKKITKKTILGIRKAQYFQEVSKDLLENLNEITSPSLKFIDISYNEENVATDLREEFNFSVDYQKGLQDDTGLFRDLIKIIEERKVFVFQFPMVKNEVRGFTLMDLEPYVIVINSSDHSRAKIFTLIHEFGHILLNIPAMCYPDADNSISGSDEIETVERWCNNFAGAFLMPKKEVTADFAVHGIGAYGHIANKYKVSQSAMLTRAKRLHIISKEFYDAEMAILKQKNKQNDDFGRGGTSVERVYQE